jgi:hypothetical protein
MYGAEMMSLSGIEADQKDMMLTSAKCHIGRLVQSSEDVVLLHPPQQEEALPATSCNRTASSIHQR